MAKGDTLLQARYPGLPITIFEQHTLERVTLIDEGAAPGESDQTAGLE